MFCERVLRCLNVNIAQCIFKLCGRKSCDVQGTTKFIGAFQRTNFHRFVTRERSLYVVPVTTNELFCRESRFSLSLQTLKYAGGVQRSSCSSMKQPCRTMAGHSKWQNIKHVKQAKDAARANTFSKLSRQIKIAVSLGKSADPKLNNQLAYLVEQARQANMPYSKIESIIKGSENSKEIMTSLTLDAKGPGGCFIIIEALTDNINRTRNNLKYQLSKFGTTFVDGSVKHAFKYKGAVNVEPVASKITLDDAVDIAIEVGAEDVMDATEDDGENVLQFQCEPREFFNVKKALMSKGYSMKSSGLRYIATQTVSLNDEQLNMMSRIFEVLDEHPDVVNFYDNVQ